MTDAGPVPAAVAGTGRGLGRRELVAGLLFLVPALVVLAVLVVYPVVFTVVRSLFDAPGDDFVGLDNYRRMAANRSTRTAIRNNAVWVIVAPTLATAIGLVLAVLTERIRFGTAVKLLIFMPMAISFLAAGVIFRFVYDNNPDVGLLNAGVRPVVEMGQPPGPYPGARPVGDLFGPTNGGYASTAEVGPGDEVAVGFVGVRPHHVPDEAARASIPRATPGTVSGVAWLDFTPGGGGERGEIDRSERGLPGMEVELVGADGAVLAAATTGDDGSFRLEGVERPGTLRLTEANFQPRWSGLDFLGPTLVTPAVIGAFLWIWCGFSMMLIAAGLAAIPRETMEAARVDGASEWQVFGRVTVPLLRPVLLVVLVTLVINVLKIFDLVLVIPPGSSQDDANVIALELWRVSFGGGRDHGLGSALGVLLFLLVVPAMIFNIRRFKSEGDME